MILGLLASWAPTVPQAAEQIATPDILPGEVVHFKTTWLDGGALLYAGTYTYSTLVRSEVRLLRQVGRYTFANGNLGEEESLLVPGPQGYKTFLSGAKNTSSARPPSCPATDAKVPPGDPLLPVSLPRAAAFKRASESFSFRSWTRPKYQSIQKV